MREIRRRAAAVGTAVHSRTRERGMGACARFGRNGPGRLANPSPCTALGAAGVAVDCRLGIEYVLVKIRRRLRCPWGVEVSAWTEEWLS